MREIRSENVPKAKKSRRETGFLLSEGFDESLHPLRGGQLEMRESQFGALLHPSRVDDEFPCRLRGVMNETRCGINIIRKTKRSEKIKRSVLPRKTKCSFFRFPPPNKKRLRFSWGVSYFLSFYFRHSSQTSHSHHLQAAALFAPNYSRICVRFRGSVLCFSVAGLSAAP